MKPSLRHAVLSTLLIASAMAVGGCGSADRMAKGIAAPESPRTLDQTPFSRSWDLELGHPVEGSWLPPELPGLMLVQLTGTHELVAIETASGHTRWVSTALPEGLLFAPMAARVRLPGGKPDAPTYDERLYAVCQDVLICFDVASGQVIWRFTLPFSPSTAPRAVGTGPGLRVYLGDWAGRMQVVGFDGEKGFPYVVWQMNLDATVNAPVVEKEGLVYGVDGGGLVHAFRLDREKAWTFRAGGQRAGTPAVRDRVLFVASDDRVVYALNRLTGEKLAQYNLGAPVVRAPLLFNGEADRVYVWYEAVGSQQGGLVALTARSDSVPFIDDKRKALDVVRMGELWRIPGAEVLVGSTPIHLFLTAKDSMTVMAVNRSTGQVDWSWDANAERLAEQRTFGQRPAEVTGIVSYHDASDGIRTFFVIDARGTLVTYRFHGAVPAALIQPVAAPAAAAPAAAAPPAAAK